MLHPNQDQLLEFVSGQFSESEAEGFYAHLAECDACAQRCQAISSIRQDFEGSWGDFLSEIASRLEAAVLEPAGERQPIFSLSIRGVLDGARRLATLASSRLQVDLGNEIEGVFAPAYHGVADATASPAARESTEEASRLCSEGNDDGALERLSEAASADAEAASSATLDLRFKGELVGKVVADSSRKSVSVIVYPDALGQTPGTALLVPASADVRGMQCPLEDVEGAGYLLAEFEDVPDGPFTLRLRPQA